MVLLMVAEMFCVTVFCATTESGCIANQKPSDLQRDKIGHKLNDNH